MRIHWKRFFGGVAFLVTLHAIFGIYFWAFLGIVGALFTLYSLSHKWTLESIEHQWRQTLQARGDWIKAGKPTDYQDKSG